MPMAASGLLLGLIPAVVEPETPNPAFPCQLQPQCRLIRVNLSHSVFRVNLSYSVDLHRSACESPST